MRSQEEKGTQNISFQTGRTPQAGLPGASAQTGMRIRGDYRHLNSLFNNNNNNMEIEESGEPEANNDIDARRSIAFYIAMQYDDEFKRLRIPILEELEQHKRVKRLIQDGHKGKALKKQQVSKGDFTDDIIMLCLEKGWTVEDFKDMGISGAPFKFPHILYALLKEKWDQTDLDKLKITDKQRSIDFTRLDEDYEHEKQRLGIDDPELKELFITAHIQSGWSARRFLQAGYTAEDFTADHIALCLKQKWSIGDFEEMGIGGEQFTVQHVYSAMNDNNWTSDDFEVFDKENEKFNEHFSVEECISAGWRGVDFYKFGIDQGEFGEEDISLALRRGWRPGDFQAVDIDLARFADDWFWDALDAGWRPGDFQAVGINQGEFGAGDIILALDEGWRPGDFQAVGIGPERFDGNSIEVALRNGWRGADFREFGIGQEEFKWFRIWNALGEGWKPEDFQAVGIGPERFLEKKYMIYLARYSGWIGADFREFGIDPDDFFR